MRRVLSVIALFAVLAGTFVVGGAAPVIATPVATNDSTYGLFGRVFPDPHGCVKGAPATSPWAKGNACAIQFVQWDEAIQGLEFLEQKFPRLLKVLSGEEMRQDAADAGLTDDELQSAGLPTETLERDKRDLVVIKVTDNQSAMPEARRKHFVYSLSIHGIERAGLEGGIRAIEDLVTWTACEYSKKASPVCDADGPFPKRILEPSNSGPTAGAVLRNAVIYFTFSNPDGWHRGEWSEGGVYFQRYNGNGMDLNRDWPMIGYTERQYTPMSEPETRGFAKYLKAVSDRTSEKKFAGGIDLHGMVTARAFSFTLLGSGQRNYQENAQTVETSIRTFRDSEQRLSWSPLIAPRESCPVARTDVNVLVSEAAVQMCSDLWGTVWDTINYQVTGSMGDWFDSPLGLDGVGIDNEMAMSHLAPNNAFDPQLEQLHIDGNKGLIYAQIASLLFPSSQRFEPTGKIGYVFDPSRITNSGQSQPAPDDLPLQPPVTGTEATGAQGFTFRKESGFATGGLIVEATGANARGVGVHTGTGVLNVPMTLQYCGAIHPGDPPGACQNVATYFNQSPIYSQAGARIDLKQALPGQYRIAPNQARVGPTTYEVTFTRGASFPEPQQLPYDVSKMDFFKELNRFTSLTQQLAAVHVKNVLADPSHLNPYDTLVVAGEFMPGLAAGKWTQAQATTYTERLRSFAEAGGNLVLTDSAVAALPALGTGITPAQVRGGFFYAGWMDFDDGQGPTYDRHHLANDVNKEGAAEGIARIGGTSVGPVSTGGQLFDNRHQTYEPGPIGYYISPSGAGNANCTSDRCDSPNWIVAPQTAWEQAGGTTAARTLVRATPQANSPTTTGVSLGELPLGSGVVRIAGALLPDPTEANFHPYGLASYSLTYTGYQLFENLVDWQRPGG